MKNIKLAYLLLIAGLTALWLLADNILSIPYDFFAYRASLINYSGIIGIGVMSVGMILAMRPAALESVLGGLDKGYRLHKWLGITGLVASVLHWLLANGPKWMVGWGWMERPQRGPRVEQTNAVFAFLDSQRGLAESVGEWAFYGAVVLMVLALVKWFPYRYFFKTHRILAIAYLALVAHAVVLMKFIYWGEIIGPLMAVLMAAGSVGAVISLTRKVGSRRKAHGTIEALEYHAENQVLKVAVKLDGRWAGHKAGQFAFVTFDPAEGPHPFTISSAWQGDGKLFFLIKGIGDYTRQLPDSLKVGDSVNVEGPYGRFEFESDKPSQIWVAGGIGITPFIARMQSLIGKPDAPAIDLFYSTSAPDKGFIERIRQIADAARIRLHVLVADKDGRLNAERIRQQVPDWKRSDVWFCGPAGFGSALRRDFASSGLSADDFHQELFDMR